MNRNVMIAIAGLILAVLVLTYGVPEKLQMLQALISTKLALYISDHQVTMDGIISTMWEEKLLKKLMVIK